MKLTKAEKRDLRSLQQEILDLRKGLEQQQEQEKSSISFTSLSGKKHYSIWVRPEFLSIFIYKVVRKKFHHQKTLITTK